MNLYDTIMKNVTVRRLGDLMLLSFGLRGGSMIVESVDLIQARKWAQQKQSLGNEVRDLQMLLDRLETYVARHGSGIAAKGQAPRLLRMAKAMQNLGLNHEDWAFPRAVADELRKNPGMPGVEPSGKEDD